MRIFYTQRHLLHATDQVIVENQPFITEEIPERARLLSTACEQVFGPLIEPLDYGLAPLLAVHTQDYLEFLSSIYARTKSHFDEDTPVFPYTFARGTVRRKSSHTESLPGYYSYGVGSPILQGTWEAAYWSAQCALSAADEVGLNSQTAYAICRPPGHHAFQALYGGFCYLNNAAIAARYLQGLPETDQPTSSQVRRVAILDVDYHHGNGTQEIFYEDPNVFFCSLHAHPDADYPYFWGASDERGAGPGEGFNLNLPLPPKCTDQVYLSALESGLVAIEEFEPRYLIVSLGLDIGEGDPVGGFSLTTKGFSQIGQMIANLNLPTLLVQEGGYRLDRLGEWILALLSAFVS